MEEAEKNQEPIEAEATNNGVVDLLGIVTNGTPTMATTARVPPTTAATGNLLDFATTPATNSTEPTLNPSNSVFDVAPAPLVDAAASAPSLTGGEPTTADILLMNSNSAEQAQMAHGTKPSIVTQNDQHDLLNGEAPTTAIEKSEEIVENGCSDARKAEMTQQKQSQEPENEYTAPSVSNAEVSKDSSEVTENGTGQVVSEISEPVASGTDTPTTTISPQSGTSPVEEHNSKVLSDTESSPVVTVAVEQYKPQEAQSMEIQAGAMPSEEEKKTDLAEPPQEASGTVPEHQSTMEEKSDNTATEEGASTPAKEKKKEKAVSSTATPVEIPSKAEEKLETNDHNEAAVPPTTPVKAPSTNNNNNTVPPKIIQHFGLDFPGKDGLSREETIQNDPIPFYKYVVRQMLEEHDPEKLPLLEKLFGKYVGREEQIIAKMASKYLKNKKPPQQPQPQKPTDTSKAFETGKNAGSNGQQPPEELTSSSTAPTANTEQGESSGTETATEPEPIQSESQPSKGVVPETPVQPKEGPTQTNNDAISQDDLQAVQQTPVDEIALSGGDSKPADAVPSSDEEAVKSSSSEDPSTEREEVTSSQLDQHLEKSLQDNANKQPEPQSGDSGEEAPLDSKADPSVEAAETKTHEGEEDPDRPPPTPIARSASFPTAVGGSPTVVELPPPPSAQRAASVPVNVISEEELAAKEVMIIELQSSLQEQLNQREEAEERARKAERRASDYEDLQSEKEVLRVQIAELKASLLGKSSEIKNLEMELVKLRETRDEHERKEIVLSNRLNAAKKKEAVKVNEAERLEEQVKFLETSLETSQKNLEEMTTTKTDVEEELATTKSTFEEKVRKAELMLLEERRLNEERKKKMKIFVEAKQEELRQTKASTDELSLELSQSNRSMREHHSRWKQLHAQWVQSQARNRELQRDLNKMKKEQDSIQRRGGKMEMQMAKSAKESEEHKNKRLTAKNELITVLETLEMERDVATKLRDSIKFTFTPKALSQQQLLKESLRDFERHLEHLSHRLGRPLPPAPDRPELFTLQEDDDAAATEIDNETDDNNGSARQKSRSQLDTSHLLNNLEDETQRVSQCIMALMNSIERMHYMVASSGERTCTDVITELMAAAGGVTPSDETTSMTGSSPRNGGAASVVGGSQRYGPI